MTDRRWWILLALLVLFTLALVTTTHRVFSQTADEPWHLVTGYDVLKRWDFKADLHHPPLARVFFALPFLDSPNPEGARGDARGNELLVRNDRYTQNVARARMPNLLFVAIAVVGVAYWARHLFTPGAGLLAALIFASLPPVLAHGGLATTDMALTATLIVALYLFTLLLECASTARAFLFGIALAAGMLAKYSFLIYFPACALILIILRRRFPARLLLSLAIAIAIVCIAIPPQHFLAGLESVRAQATNPPKAFLLGEVREGGWWYYFPVALFFKSPIPFLILALWSAATRVAAVFSPAAAGASAKDSGNWRCRTPHRLELALIAAAILAIAMTSNINIGVRHILPIYAPLAMLAAVAFRKRWLNAALIAWLVIGSAFAHPDYLAHFNEFAGREPHRILNDSNLDWGQDALRLVRLARKEKIPSITTSLPWSAPLDHIGLPPRTVLQALQPVHGWLAISELNIALGRDLSPEIRRWLDDLLVGRPYRRVGKSIRLYYFDQH